MRCKKCGRLMPQMARGTVTRKPSDRLLVYEGHASKPFTYKPHDQCLVCRTGGTRGTLSKMPVVGAALKAELVRLNARPEKAEEVTITWAASS